MKQGKARHDAVEAAANNIAAKQNMLNQFKAAGTIWIKF
jgi:hypothetical protein